MSEDARIIALLARHPDDGLSGAEISLILGLGSGKMYPVLLRLEQEGRMSDARDIIARAEGRS